jgi:hypothetical protein
VERIKIKFPAGMLDFNQGKPGCINIQFGRLMDNCKKNEIFHLIFRFNIQVKWVKAPSIQNILIYVVLLRLNPVIFNPEDFYKSLLYSEVFVQFL